jgi:hypothetical protein
VNLAGKILLNGLFEALNIGHLFRVEVAGCCNDWWNSHEVPPNGQVTVPSKTRLTESTLSGIGPKGNIYG